MSSANLSHAKKEKTGISNASLSSARSSNVYNSTSTVDSTATLEPSTKPGKLPKLKKLGEPVTSNATLKQKRAAAPSKTLPNAKSSNSALASNSSIAPPVEISATFNKARRDAIRPSNSITAKAKKAAASSSLRSSSSTLPGDSAVKPTLKKHTHVKPVPASLMRPTSASLAKQREKSVAVFDDSANKAYNVVKVESTDTLDAASEEEENDEEFYNQESDNRKMDQYPPTPHQLAIFNKVCPDVDDAHPKPTSPTVPVVMKSKLHYTTQCFKLSNGAMKEDLLCRTINKIASIYKILTTSFYKNERILDADVEAHIDDKTPASSYGLDKFTLQHHTTAIITSETVSKYLKQWMSGLVEGRLDPVFQAFLFTSEQTSDALIAFAFSNSIADTHSCIFVTNEIFHLYFEALQRENILAANKTIDTYKPKEHDNFADFAYNLPAASRNTLSVWKHVCIETIQETIEGPERSQLETQRKHLLHECHVFKGQVSTLTQRKAELEIELTTLRFQRRQMDVDNHGPVEVHVDPVTQQVTEVSKAARTAMRRLVLGDDAEQDCVAGFLSKHDCSDDIQYKIGKMSMEEFSALLDDDLVVMGLLSKDRRKVMALSEYVRNRVKESMQEQTKIKFALERKILKQQREYDMVASNLKAAQNSLDISDDMAIRLGHILNPPSHETRLLPISIEGKKAAETPFASHQDAWGYFPFEIDAAVVKTVRSFKELCKAHERHMRQTKSKAELDHDTDDMASSGDDDDNFADIKPQNSKVCCLAAYAVMLKHIAGCEKFLIGCVESFRKNGVLVGPLSDVIPVKFDFAGNETSFNAVLSQVNKALRNCSRFIAESPFSETAKTLNLESEFPIQFQYFSEKETVACRHVGMSTRDLLSMKVFSAHESKPESTIVDIERLWTVDEQSHTCEFKLVLVEDADEIVGAIHYRKDFYDDDKVQKWVAKFITTLEGLEYSPKKLSISNLISRYYSSVLLHAKGEDGIEKRESKRSLASISNLAGSNSNGLFNM
ncbi:hypothetical protein CcCBS67573_g03129 [Chytriomyces confervae]|uniref:Uncharacterized protein n=1 Tax=Chytriomyces confervae TaxID=246404 RepID=A0A507FKP0_9FUNG|nr:hypothetical protein CcCBS67573_g03129 [Chytriomyces confervae]